ncbi:FAD-binding protein, partial [bacterium]|nr:FAD-binding protein [bacterium]
MSWETIYNRIEDEFGEDAVRNAPMSERINFRVGGPADILVRPRHIARLQRLMRLISGTDVPTFIFSGGSNLIVRDGGIRGVVIDVSQGFDEMSFTRMPDGTTHLFIGAGRTVADMVDACAERGLAGVEWGAGIPGTVGGGIKGNAGTRDGDFAGSLRSVQMVEFDGHLSDYERRDLVFRYRGLVK